MCKSDYIIDMDPDGGDLGGHAIATGSPEELVTQSDLAYTGWYILLRINWCDVSS